MPLSSLKQVAQILTAAVLYELHNERLDAAHTNLWALVRFVAAQSPEPLIVHQLIRFATATFAFNATWQALQAPGWTDDQLASLQAIWQQCAFSQDLGASMEMERAMSLDFYDQVIASKHKLDLVATREESAAEMTDGLLNPLPTRGLLLRWVHLPLWRFAWSRQDQLRALNRWQHIIERERLARSNSWAVLSSSALPNEDIPWILFREEQDRSGWSVQIRFLFSREPFSITDRVIRRAFIAETLQNLAVTAIALRRYQLRTGTFPPDLATLVPNYLPAPPHDNMDGKALRYRLRPESPIGFLLYSVGEDAADDGGDSQLRSGADKTIYGQIWDGRDAVWPVPATAEEAATALHP